MIDVYKKAIIGENAKTIQGEKGKKSWKSTIDEEKRKTKIIGKKKELTNVREKLFRCQRDKADDCVMTGLRRRRRERRERIRIKRERRGRRRRRGRRGRIRIKRERRGRTRRR